MGVKDHPFESQRCPVCTNIRFVSKKAAKLRYFWLPFSLTHTNLFLASCIKLQPIRISRPSIREQYFHSMHCLYVNVYNIWM
jgi:hypothetical protein